MLAVRMQYPLAERLLVEALSDQSCHVAATSFNFGSVDRCGDREPSIELIIVGRGFRSLGGAVVIRSERARRSCVRDTAGFPRRTASSLGHCRARRPEPLW